MACNRRSSCSSNRPYRPRYSLCALKGSTAEEEFQMGGYEVICPVYVSKFRSTTNRKTLRKPHPNAAFYFSIHGAEGRDCCILVGFSGQAIFTSVKKFKQLR